MDNFFQQNLEDFQQMIDLDQILQFTCDQQQYTQKNSQLNQQLLFRSTFKQSYLQYFKDIEQQVTKSVNKKFQDTQALKNYGICTFQKLLQLEQSNLRFISLSNIEDFGKKITFQITISFFKLQIKIKNLISQSPCNLKFVGQGSFGEIFRLNYGRPNQILLKRLTYIREYQQQSQKSQSIKVLQKKKKEQRNEIYSFILEYCIYKLCSYFQIGPKMISDFNCDLMCFTDCIQFYMQQCFEVGKQDKQVTIQQFSKRMKFCIRLMHKIKIVHRDIKPSHILFSTTLETFIILDFGISHSILQELGENTKTYKSGTPNYISSNMSKIKDFQEGYVDLYQNDRFALQMSLNNYTKSKLYRKKTSQRKSKSIDSFYLLMHCMSLLERRGIEFYYFLKLNYQKIQIEQISVFLQNIGTDIVNSFFSYFRQNQVVKLLDEQSSLYFILYLNQLFNCLNMQNTVNCNRIQELSIFLSRFLKSTKCQLNIFCDQYLNNNIQNLRSELQNLQQNIMQIKQNLIQQKQQKIMNRINQNYLRILEYQRRQQQSKIIFQSQVKTIGKKQFEEQNYMIDYQ